jgi:hypothetical protein
MDGDWKTAAEGWMAQTEREVALRESLAAENARLRDEAQAVLDCVNLYGDETLHKALDSIGWKARA